MGRFKIPGFGANLRRNALPDYDRDQTLEQNWRRFFEWGLELRQPHVTIPELPNVETVTHAIGFTAVYLTPRSRGIETLWVKGVIRANVIRPGVKLRDDIHSHGYWFVSGLVDGEVTNNSYDMDFSVALPDGEGKIGYETRTDVFGVNHVKQATDATIAVPGPRVRELAVGDNYSMLACDEFHSLSTDGGITIFGKEPAGVGGASPASIRDISLILRDAHQPAPPAEY